jgi:hypothetical protein
MAAEEIPVSAYASKLLNRGDTAEGTVACQTFVADAASELLQDIFGKEKNPCRLVYGVASLPLGTPVELEIISR